MKRRTFLGFAVMGGTIVAETLLNRQDHNFFAGNSALYPSVLSHICSDDVLRRIGTSYMALFPRENTEGRLQELLLPEKVGNKSISFNSPLVAELLEKRAQNDFCDHNTVIVNGWVLSLTEARQCALLSLS